MQLKSILMAAILAPGLAIAGNTFTHLSGTLFTDGLVTINYPCTAGGEPLVIYSTGTNNTTPVISGQLIAPAYVKEGYTALPLQVGEGGVTHETATNRLLIQSINPATTSSAISFTLSRSQDFFVNSINFAAIDAPDDAHMVASFAIATDHERDNTVVPLRMFNFVQDTGFYIFRNVHEVKAVQYSWSEQAPWRDQNGLNAKHLIRYFFQPIKSPSSVIYNGYGFWICGKEKVTSVVETPKTVKTWYVDAQNGEKS